MAVALKKQKSLRRSGPPGKDVPGDLEKYVPAELSQIENHQVAIPAIAKNPKLVARIREVLKEIPTTHRISQGDARSFQLPKESVHLVLTSPPYWTLKEYRDTEGQLGHVSDYDDFLADLRKVWKRCFDALVPGGRLVCVVGDVCLSRRQNKGRHTVVPLHAAIQEQCRKLGYDNLAPIIWHKISNAVFEADGNSGTFLGKPYEPNSVIKNDIEYILMLRKPGGYRSPTLSTRILSVISEDDHRSWFQQIWTGVTGASTKNHPAPYPQALADRLIRMFSFVGDTILDPFSGTGTTTAAAMQCGRNSIGIEIDSEYIKFSQKRIENAKELFDAAEVSFDGRL